MGRGAARIGWRALLGAAAVAHGLLPAVAWAEADAAEGADAAVVDAAVEAEDAAPPTFAERLERARERAADGSVARAYLEARALHKDAKARGATDEAAAAWALVVALEPRTSRVRFVLPRDVPDLRLVFDDRPVVDPEKGKWYSVDPGTHRVAAEGTRDGEPVVYDVEVTTPAGSIVTITIVPARYDPRGPVAPRGCGGCGAARGGAEEGLATLVTCALALAFVRRRRVSPRPR